ncbi:MAG: aspartate 1-decarboxylase, partial [Rhodococcus sp.]|nr:aspartate 1-decarboxylase [Rhodococcus sp. (in: high G+C Gram-positive bacteria)]
HLVNPGDLVILIAYGVMNEAELRDYAPRVVFVDADNNQVELGSDPAHAPEGSGLITPRMLSTAH